MLKDVQVGDLLHNTVSGTVAKVFNVQGVGESAAAEILTRTDSSGPVEGSGIKIELPNAFWKLIPRTRQVQRTQLTERVTPSPKYIEHLRARVRKQESELSHLKATLANAEKELSQWVGENLV